MSRGGGVQHDRLERRGLLATPDHDVDAEEGEALDRQQDELFAEVSGDVLGGASGLTAAAAVDAAAPAAGVASVEALMAGTDRSNVRISTENVHRAWLREWRHALRLWHRAEESAHARRQRWRVWRAAGIYGAEALFVLLLAVIFYKLSWYTVSAILLVCTWIFVLLLGIEYVFLGASLCLKIPAYSQRFPSGEAPAPAGRSTRVAAVVVTCHDMRSDVESTLRSVVSRAGSWDEVLLVAYGRTSMPTDGSRAIAALFPSVRYCYVPSANRAIALRWSMLSAFTTAARVFVIAPGVMLPPHFDISQELSRLSEPGVTLRRGGNGDSTHSHSSTSPSPVMEGEYPPVGCVAFNVGAACPDAWPEGSVEYELIAGKTTLQPWSACADLDLHYQGAVRRAQDRFGAVMSFDAAASLWNRGSLLRALDIVTESGHGNDVIWGAAFNAGAEERITVSTVPVLRLSRDALGESERALTDWRRERHVAVAALCKILAFHWHKPWLLLKLTAFLHVGDSLMEYLRLAMLMLFLIEPSGFIGLAAILGAIFIVQLALAVLAFFLATRG